VVTPIKPPQRPGAPGQPEPAEGRGRHATDELADECAALETEVEELKVKYEMYFLGVERNEPNKAREELRKKVLRLKERFTRNAGVRFRVQSLHARFISYERLWMRSAREKEEGTYRRDLFKARLRSQHGAGPAGVKGKKEVLRFSQAEDVDLTDFGGGDEASGPAARPIMAARPAAGAQAKPARPAEQGAPVSGPPVPPPPTPSRAPAPAAPGPTARPAAASAPGVDARTRALYEAYVAARRSCNQDLNGITLDAIARTIAKQTPEIMKQHKARTVEFKVEVKDGRAILKAVPKI
jgi:FtsZ-binding cell division protein ZapB